MEEINDQVGTISMIRSGHLQLHGGEPVKDCPVCTLLGFNHPPIKGRLLESYRMVFLDFSEFDGENNIHYINNTTMAINKRAFKTVVPGAHYELPVYRIEEGKGIVETGAVQPINFVRGSKQAGDPKTPQIVQDHGPLEGTLHEHLISVMIEDLKMKNAEVPSREGAIVITKLEEARHWMEERQKSREAAGVVGTYSPVEGNQ